MGESKLKKFEVGGMLDLDFVRDPSCLSFSLSLPSSLSLSLSLSLSDSLPFFVHLFLSHPFSPISFSHLSISFSLSLYLFVPS